MKRHLKAVALCFLSTAVPALADCDEDFDLVFYCDIPEHNAAVLLCENHSTKEAEYNYWVDGQMELEFKTKDMWGELKKKVRGIPPPPIEEAVEGTAYVNGTTYYAVWADKEKTAAVLHVYDSKETFQPFDEDKPIARRSCDPNSIIVDEEWFGFG